MSKIFKRNLNCSLKKVGKKMRVEESGNIECSLYTVYLCILSLSLSSSRDHFFVIGFVHLTNARIPTICQAPF